MRNFRKIKELQLRLEIILGNEEYDRLEAVVIASTSGWINCILNYKLEIHIKDFEELESEVKTYELLNEN